MRCSRAVLKAAGEVVMAGGFMLIVATGAKAQRSLTLAEAVAGALASHPSVAAAAMVKASASSTVREAKSARLPSLYADASGTRFGESMVVAPLHGFNPEMPPAFDRTLMQGSVSLNYTLVDVGRGARIDRATALESVADAGVEEARQSLIAAVANVYLAVRGAREVVAAHEARVAALERERERAAQFFTSGREARVVLLRAEAALWAARADRVTAASQLDATERELARIAGLEATVVAGGVLPALALTAEGRSIDRERAVTLALGGNAEITQVRRRIMAAEAAGDEASALWLPRVQLSGRYVEYASGSGHESGEWQGGAHISYALFTGGARGAAAERAAAELGAARADLALTELRVGGAIDAAIAAWRGANGRVEALEAAVAQSEEVARIEQLALDAGAGVQTDYLVAEAELLRVRAALTEAKQMVVSERIGLGLITGELSEQWLARNVETSQ